MISWERYKNKYIYLGIYENKEDAISVRKEAEIKYFGEFRFRGVNFACTNHKNQQS
jgi:hypothetical protein